MNFNNSLPYTINEQGVATSSQDMLSKINFFMTTTSNFNSVLDTNDYIVVERDGKYYHFQTEAYDGDAIVSDYIHFFIFNSYTPGNTFYDYGVSDFDILSMRVIGNVEQYYLYDNGVSIFFSLEFEPGTFNSLFVTKPSEMKDTDDILFAMANYNRTDIKFESVLGNQYQAIPSEIIQYKQFLFNGLDSYTNGFITRIEDLVGVNSIENSFLYLNDKYYLFQNYLIVNDNYMLAHFQDIFFSYMEGYANAEEFTLNNKEFKAFPNFQKTSPPSNDDNTLERCIIIRIL